MAHAPNGRAAVAPELLTQGCLARSLTTHFFARVPIPPSQGCSPYRCLGGHLSLFLAARRAVISAQIDLVSHRDLLLLLAFPHCTPCTGRRRQPDEDTCRADGHALWIGTGIFVALPFAPIPGQGVFGSPPCLVYHKIGTYRTELELRLAMIQGVVPSRSTQRIVVRGQRVSEVSRCGPSCSVLQ
jgi:hypothetical protein